MPFKYRLIDAEYVLDSSKPGVIIRPAVFIPPLYPTVASYTKGKGMDVYRLTPSGMVHEKHYQRRRRRPRG
jgi:hypothetical protein